MAEIPDVWALPPSDVLCSDDVSDPMTREWRQKQRQSLGCRKPARYEIDGKPYCKAHAGALLLKMFALREKPR